MWVVYLLAFSAFFSTIATSLLAPVEALYLQKLSGSYGSAGFAMSMGFISFLLLAPLIGRLSDIVGRRKIILALTFLGATTPLLLTLSKNVYQYSLFKFIGGTAACAIAPIMAFLGDTVERTKKKGLAFGIYIMGSSIGGALGALLGGAVSSFSGSLKTPYLVSFVLSFISFLLIFIALRRPEVKNKISIKEHIPAFFNLKLLKILKLPLIAVLVMKFVFMFHMSMKSIMWPNMISKFLGESHAPFYTAIVFSSMGFLAGVLSPIIGKLSDKYGHMNFFFMGWFVMGVVGTLFYMANSFVLLFALSLLYALGEIMKGPAANALITKYSTKANRGFVYGLVTSTTSLASFAGLSITGKLMEVVDWNSILLAYGLMILAPALVFYVLIKRNG